MAVARRWERPAGVLVLALAGVASLFFTLKYNRDFPRYTFALVCVELRVSLRHLG